MKIFLHSTLLILTIFGVYLWLQIDVLNNFSLQAFSLAALLFFVLKKLKRAKFWHLTPSQHSAEMALVTFALMLLIGSTGNTESVFFPLTYLHLFLLVLSTHPIVAGLAGMTTFWFHLALSGPTGESNLSHVFSIPVLLVIFLFARKQHEELLVEKTIIAAEEKELSAWHDHEKMVENFLKNFLQPKLEQLSSLITTEKTDTIANQAELITSETEKFLRQFQEQNQELTHEKEQHLTAKKDEITQ